MAHVQQWWLCLLAFAPCPPHEPRLGACFGRARGRRFDGRTTARTVAVHSLLGEGERFPGPEARASHGAWSRSTPLWRGPCPTSVVVPLTQATRSQSLFGAAPFGPYCNVRPSKSLRALDGLPSAPVLPARSLVALRSRYSEQAYPGVMASSPTASWRWHDSFG